MSRIVAPSATKISTRVGRLAGADGRLGAIRDVGDGVPQPAQPAVEQPMTLLDRPLPFVGEVVGRAGKRVDRRHVMPHVAAAPAATRPGKFS